MNIDMFQNAYFKNCFTLNKPKALIENVTTKQPQPELAFWHSLQFLNLVTQDFQRNDSQHAGILPNKHQHSNSTNTVTLRCHYSFTTVSLQCQYSTTTYSTTTVSELQYKTNLMFGDNIRLTRHYFLHNCTKD